MSVPRFLVPLLAISLLAISPGPARAENGKAADTPTTTPPPPTDEPRANHTVETRQRQRRLDAHQFRFGAAPDRARPRAVLRRARPQQERPVSDDAVHRDGGVISLQWFVIGYSIAFHEGAGWGRPQLGVSLRNQTRRPNGLGCADNIPHVVFMIFQLMFAIITPALICGVAERMKFSACCSS